MAKDYFIGLGIAQILCGLTTIGTQVHREDHLNLDLRVAIFSWKFSLETTVFRWPKEKKVKNDNFCFSYVLCTYFQEYDNKSIFHYVPHYIFTIMYYQILSTF